MQELQYEKTVIGYPDFKEFIQLLENKTVIKSAILFGSVARNDENYQSDIDLAIWIDEEENLELIDTFWQEKNGFVLNIPRKNSKVIFTAALKKIDILIINDLAGINRNYLGSMIPSNRIFETILFDKTKTVVRHLTNLITKKALTPIEYDLNSLVDYFIFNFESCSKSHAKSDGYQFYFNYNIALHTVIQLQYLKNGHNDFLYNPKNAIYKSWTTENTKELYDLSGTLFLPDANKQKRKLLNQFYKIIKVLMPNRFTVYQSICEGIYNRDYFWNYRDYNIHNPTIKPNKIFRSATLSLYKKNKVESLLSANKITTILDLRANQEVEQLPYSSDILQQFQYIQAPFDPWHQPKWFEEEYHFGTNREIAYRFFLKGCQASFKKVIDTIIENKGTTLIHCHAGKDRTGLVLGAIQLLLKCDIEAIKKDYMASGSDVDLSVFQLLFDEVEFHGSIEKFFEYQGVMIEKQQQLIKKLKK